MPEQESSPELQAAREDALKRVAEVDRQVLEKKKGAISLEDSANAQRLADERDRLEEECRKLGISDDTLREQSARIEDEVYKKD